MTRWNRDFPRGEGDESSLQRTLTRIMACSFNSYAKNYRFCKEIDSIVCQSYLSLCIHINLNIFKINTNTFSYLSPYTCSSYVFTQSIRPDRQSFQCWHFHQSSRKRFRDITHNQFQMDKTKRIKIKEKKIRRNYPGVTLPRTELSKNSGSSYALSVP